MTAIRNKYEIAHNCCNGNETMKILPRVIKVKYDDVNDVIKPQMSQVYCVCTLGCKKCYFTFPSHQNYVILLPKSDN